MNTTAANTTTTTTTITTAPTTIGTLRINERLIDSRINGTNHVFCKGFTALRVGDTLCATGFKSGGTRKVIGIAIVGGVGYVHVKEGWYRWVKAYVHVI